MGRPPCSWLPAARIPGSCTATAPCASFQRAYEVAAPGATVEVAGGTYSSQTFRAVSGKTGPNVLFRPAAGARVILGSLGFGSGGDAALGPDLITVRGMETTYKGSDPGAGNQRGIHVAPGSTNITLESMDAGSISSWFADRLTVRGGDYGPCDAVTGSNVCSNNKQEPFDKRADRGRLLPRPGVRLVRTGCALGVHVHQRKRQRDNPRQPLRALCHLRSLRHD